MHKGHAAWIRAFRRQERIETTLFILAWIIVVTLAVLGGVYL